MEYDYLLDEVSDAIATEYAIMEEMSYLICDEDISLSQLELSEIGEDKLLLCPFCQYSAMNTPNADDRNCYCAHCDSVIRIQPNGFDVQTLRELLAGVFDRFTTFSL